MKALFYILPFLAGVAITIQSGINYQLRVAIKSPMTAAFISFLVGTIALGIILFFYRSTVPALPTYQSLSWYKWTGGLLGVFVVTVTLLSVQEIGAANMFVIIIAGQLITAVMMDHFAVLGLRHDPINLQKTVGILLLVAGAYLVNKK